MAHSEIPVQLSIHLDTFQDSIIRLGVIGPVPNGVYQGPISPSKAIFDIFMLLDKIVYPLRETEILNWRWIVKKYQRIDTGALESHQWELTAD